MRFAPAAFAIMVPLLAGCSGGAGGASETATRLLTAAWKQDRVAFEAEVDRDALRADVRRQVADVARASALEVEGGPSEFALDRMISPDAFHVTGPAGAALTDPPQTAQVKPLITTGLDGKACLRSAGATAKGCQLTFAKTKGKWRLVAMQAMDLRIELAR